MPRERRRATPAQAGQRLPPRTGSKAASGSRRSHPAFGTVQQVRKVARLLQQAQFEQQAGLGRCPVHGQMVEKGLQQGKGSRMPVRLPEKLLHQFAAVTGQGDRRQVGAQPGPQIEQFGLFEGDQLTAAEAPVQAHPGKRLKGRAESAPAVAGAAGEPFQPPLIRSEESDDAVRLAIIEMAQDNGVGKVDIHGTRSCAAN